MLEHNKKICFIADVFSDCNKVQGERMGKGSFDKPRRPNYT